MGLRVRVNINEQKFFVVTIRKFAINDFAANNKTFVMYENIIGCNDGDE